MTEGQNEIVQAKISQLEETKQHIRPYYAKLKSDRHYNLCMHGWADRVVKLFFMLIVTLIFSNAVV